MAAPNIVNVATITGKTAVANVTTTATDIVNNAAASNKVLKINTLMVSNINATASANLTASVFRSSIEYRVAANMVVPAGSTLMVITKDTATYLEEGDSVRITATANSILQAVSSYEEIS